MARFPGPPDLFMLILVELRRLRIVLRDIRSRTRVDGRFPRTIIVVLDRGTIVAFRTDHPPRASARLAVVIPVSHAPLAFIDAVAVIAGFGDLDFATVATLHL